MSLLCPRCHKFTIAGPVRSQLFCQCHQSAEEKDPLNTSTHCPVCGKPYWTYGIHVTSLTVITQATAYQIYPSDYCVGHIVAFTFQPAPQERTEVPKVFYDAFESEGV